MRKYLALLLIIIFVSAGAAKQYMHTTGRVSLIVNDNYLGGFYYHNLLSTGEIDNLWRAFIAIHFNEFGDEVCMGIGNDYGPLGDTIFVLVDTLVVVMDSTLVTSSTVYKDRNSRVQIKQVVASGRNNEYFLTCCFTVKNIGRMNLTGGRAMLFYEGDLPADDFDNDYTGRIPNRYAVFEYDNLHNIYTGITFVSGAGFLGDGNFRDWYHYGQSFARVLELMNSPSWDEGIQNTDCAVYEVISLGSLGVGDTTPTLKFAFVAGESLKQIEKSIYDAWGETTSVPVSGIQNPVPAHFFPNPFNDFIAIDYFWNEPGIIELYDIRGTKLAEFPVERGKREICIPGGRFPTGVIIYRICSANNIQTGRIVHLK